MASLFGTLLGVCRSTGRGTFGQLVRSVSFGLRNCTADIFDVAAGDAPFGASTQGNHPPSALQGPKLSNFPHPEKQFIPQSAWPFFQNLECSRVFSNEAAQLASRDATGKHGGEESGQGKDALIEEGFDLSKQSAPAQGASDSASAVKKCIECQSTKLVCDFKETAAYPDRRSPTCRACLAVLKPRRLKQPLLHLGLTPKEAWERPKECKTCGLKKELRDFAVYRSKKDGLQRSCRSCVTAAQARMPIRQATDSPQQCRICNIVKPASSFPKARRMPNGLYPECRQCAAKRCRERYASLSQVDKLHIPKPQRVDKICSHCGQLKSPSDFHDNVSSRDCLSTYCKTCAHNMGCNTRAAKRAKKALRQGGQGGDGLACESK